MALDQSDPDNWPVCRVCGKKPREGRHSTDLGEGHGYEPAVESPGVEFQATYLEFLDLTAETALGRLSKAAKKRDGGDIIEVMKTILREAYEAGRRTHLTEKA